MKKYTELNLINLLLKKIICCETEESLEQIKYEKEELEKKLNELIESSRENISEYFRAFLWFSFCYL